MATDDGPAADQDEVNAAGLSALADRTRRALYDFVAQQTTPVTREQAAVGVGVATHTAKFHLDRLVAAGLLEPEFRRVNGRRGPGAGRPAKLYRRADREFSVSLPPRHYDLLSDILARAVESVADDGGSMLEAASLVSRGEGRARGAAAAEHADETDPLERLATGLRPLGYLPSLDGRRMVLENCPFDRVARDHTELVCGLNLDFVTGVASGLGCRGLAVSLEPSPGRCCVSARREGE